MTHRLIAILIAALITLLLFYRVIYLYMKSETRNAYLWLFITAIFLVVSIFAIKAITLISGSKLILRNISYEHIYRNNTILVKGQVVNIGTKAVRNIYLKLRISNNGAAGGKLTLFAPTQSFKKRKYISKALLKGSVTLKKKIIDIIFPKRSKSFVFYTNYPEDYQDVSIKPKLLYW